ncbi:AMP-dependent synthetase/ligase [Desulfurella sp.]|uniref:AMP-dependent synthetase/ligase n=1 Tax=Desulfurella sp. TaxID=1962857 RepID=UPI003D0D1C05
MENWPFKSLPDMLRQNALVYKDKIAIAYKKTGGLTKFTYDDFYRFTLMVSRGLKKLGVNQKDKVAILSETRTMWSLADFGIMNLGAIVVPIYHTNTPEQIAYIINHSESRIVFVSDKTQYLKLLEVRDQIPNIEFVIAHDRFLGDKKLPLITFYQVSEISEPLSANEQKEIEALIENIDIDDTFTIKYTSGTTAEPKGVELTHKNLISNIYYINKKANNLIDSNDIFLTFLPFSHILGRADSYYLPLAYGAQIAFAESIEKIADNILEFKPTIIVTVPRLLEKIYSKILDSVHHASNFKRSLFHQALSIAKEYIEARYVNNNLNATLELKYKFFDRLVFSKIRQKLGLENFKTFVSGGAPLEIEVNKFFWGLGIKVLEGFGLTETSPVLCVNSFEKMKFGSVGTLIDDTQIKVASDGELLFKGPQITKGYYKAPDLNKEAFDEEGFFKTGDIGKIDEEGFIYITDRKKEIIVTAGGKNIAPAPIENALKLSKYISNAYVYGDRKPYLVALVTMNIERVLEFAKENHLHYFDIGDLSKNEKMLDLFKSEIEEINKTLARYETIKKFSILPHDFSIEGGELTPTLKLKRRVIYKKYTDKIECLYTEDGNCFSC